MDWLSGTQEKEMTYHGMCELQVLDNTHPRCTKLDPRQFHGSLTEL